LTVTCIRVKPMLNQLAALLDRPFISPDGLTLTGFVIGVLALPFLVLNSYLAALVAIVLNRLLDGLDGALARRRGLSDAGGFLDIALDFLFYAWCRLASRWRHLRKMRWLRPGCCLLLWGRAAVFWRLRHWLRNTILITPAMRTSRFTTLVA
jgi:phosphatidylglycerophosphate synthase